MRAIGYQIPGAIDREDALVDIELPDPVAAGRDLLVEVRAISVNPVDAKIRNGAKPPEGEWKVVGWDAAGVVRAVGPDVTRFQPGDEVYYAGQINRAGANSELHLIDERIVGHKPKSLDWGEAAAMPLTTLTAYEMLFDRLNIERPVSGANSILIIGAAGGVGSMAVQLVRRLTGLTIIGTASRPDTADWIRELGAHEVLDHTKPLAAQFKDKGLAAPGMVFCTTHTEQHLPEIVKLIAPQGRFGLIDEPASPLDARAFRGKSVSIHWEGMFTRSLFQTADMGAQGDLLDRVAGLVDDGHLRTTVTERLAPISAATLKQVHAALESNRTRGKIVVEGWA